MPTVAIVLCDLAVRYILHATLLEWPVDIPVIGRAWFFVQGWSTAIIIWSMQCKPYFS